MNSPSGLTTAQPTIEVAKTFGRSGGGTRSVRIACMLGLTSPFAIPEAKISAAKAIAGSGRQRYQRREGWTGAQAAIAARPSKRRVRKRKAIALPTSAPAPKDAI